MGYLRRAGHGRLADGRLVTWSVAEGARGRRWRWIIATGEGTLEHAGLIELDGSGRFGRLELETAVGMLTLHPADDGAAAHGNVVRTDRVDPIIVPWATHTGIRFARDPFAGALLGGAGPKIAIAADLTLSVGEHVTDLTMPEIDDRGVPRLDQAREWPLEV